MFWNIFQASGYPIVTVQLEDNEEDVADGGETVALSVQQNSSSFLDDFYKQVMISVSIGCVWILNALGTP